MQVPGCKPDAAQALEKEDDLEKARNFSISGPF
jgi:hypothetical protein